MLDIMKEGMSQFVAKYPHKNVCEKWHKLRYGFSMKLAFELLDRNCPVIGRKLVFCGKV